MQGFHLFLSVFGIIFVAELPDKTALAAVVLATRHRPLPVFLGAAAALTLQSVIAVAAGGLVAFLPARPVHIGAGLLFIASAYFMWHRKEETEELEARSKRTQGAGFWRATWTVFLVVFVAEWGDLTQLGTAALAARYGHPLIVFTGATAALWCVAGLAVFLGNRAGRLFSPALTQKVAAVCFVAIGLALSTGIL